MKAVVIFGSPNRKGYTRMLADSYIASLPSECTVREFNAYDIDAAPCMGCGGCKNANICIFDDLDDLIAALFECDIIVFASPVYYLSVPAPLKAIIDRFQRFHEADKRGDNILKNKERKAVLLLTAGSPSERGEVIIKQMRWILQGLGAVLDKVVVCPNTDKMDAESFESTIEFG